MSSPQCYIIRTLTVRFVLFLSYIHGCPILTKFAYFQHVPKRVRCKTFRENSSSGRGVELLQKRQTNGHGETNRHFS